MIKGYCQVEDVATFLGRSFTAGQAGHCGSLIERAEGLVDTLTARGWLTGVAVGERHYMGSSVHVWLRYAPVASVEGVTGRSGPDGAEVALVAGVDYETASLEAGQLVLLGGRYAWERLTVDYTQVASVPGDITQATVEIVANWMSPVLHGGAYGLDSVQLPDYTVRFARSHLAGGVPPVAGMVLENWRWRSLG